MTDTPQLATKNFYFNSIDGLRLLASLNVVLFHLEYIGGLNDMGGSPGWLFRIIKGPAFHATLFFILGGFIFTTKFAQKVSTFDSTSFLKKRFRELYPLHLITTLTMVALHVIKRLGTEAIDIPKLCYSLFMHLSFLWPFYPFGSMSLNTPSWALAAMFFCYLLFKPLLKFCVSLKNRTAVMLAMAACFALIIAWGYLFSSVESHAKLYQFFHVFSPARFFEFALGALLAQFFMLRKADKKPLFYAIRCDIIFALAVSLIILNLGSDIRPNIIAKWFSYHVYMIPLYMLLIYAASIEKGLFAKILAIPTIQKLGRTSFYPYLLHIPLISIVTLFCERVLSYKKFLHSPINVVVFVVILYGGSYFYMYAIRNKRRARGNQQ